MRCHHAHRAVLGWRWLSMSLADMPGSTKRAPRRRSLPRVAPPSWSTTLLLISAALRPKQLQLSMAVHSQSKIPVRFDSSRIMEGTVIATETMPGTNAVVRNEACHPAGNVVMAKAQVVKEKEGWRGRGVHGEAGDRPGRRRQRSSSAAGPRCFRLAGRGRQRSYAPDAVQALIDRRLLLEQVLRHDEQHRITSTGAVATPFAPPQFGRLQVIRAWEDGRARCEVSPSTSPQIALLEGFVEAAQATAAAQECPLHHQVRSGGRPQGLRSRDRRGAISRLAPGSTRSKSRFASTR